MIKKPWKIWSLFGLCLLASLTAMCWLSIKAVRLERLREQDRLETQRARVEADLQDRINTALYRMDLRMMPLVSLEASRPYYFYDAPFPMGSEQQAQSVGKPVSSSPSGPRTTISPLLFEMPEFVRLHFEVQPDGEICSPQLPPPQHREAARERYGVTESFLKKCLQRLNTVQEFCTLAHLQAHDVEGGVWIFEQSSESDLPLVQLNGFLDSSGNLLPPQLGKVDVAKGLDAFPFEQPSALQANTSDSSAVAQKSTDPDFNRRLNTIQDITSQQTMTNSMNMAGTEIGGQRLTGGNANSIVVQGIMQPLWIDRELLLARRVQRDGQSLYQCCWLDWPAIRAALQSEVDDILPKIDLVPIDSEANLQMGTSLTTIPIRLSLDSPNYHDTLRSAGTLAEPTRVGFKMALWAAWCGLGLAVMTTAILLHGVIRMSERRGAFVSAVTHELRTPLTTFRMYAEMLAEDMVSPEKKREYACTLTVQADRLSHLVENVLQFARLERSSQPATTATLPLAELLQRCEAQLHERAIQGGMHLEIELPDSLANCQVRTQPAHVEQILYNLVDNACKYARPSAEPRIVLSGQRQGEWLQLRVRDFGPGIPTWNRGKIFRPFHKSDQDAANSEPGVGLGLALCKRMATAMNGRLYHAPANPGARFVLELRMRSRV